MIMNIIAEYFYPRTVLFILAFLGLVIGIVAFTTSQTLKTNQNGIKTWMGSMYIFALAILLFFLRGSIPDFISTFVANLLILVAEIALSIAYCQSFGTQIAKKELRMSFIVALIGMTISYIYSLPLSVPACIVSLASIVILSTMLSPLISHFGVSKNPLLCLPIASISLLIILCALRILTVLLGNPNNVALTAPSMVQLGFYIAMVLAVLSTTLGFMIMVYERQKVEWLTYATTDKISGLPTQNNYRE